MKNIQSIFIAALLFGTATACAEPPAEKSPVEPAAVEEEEGEE